MSTHRPTIHQRPELRDGISVFLDREAAANCLLDLIDEHGLAADLALSISLGGAPIAGHLARALSIPVDGAPVAPVTPPGEPEAIYGAMAWDGTLRIDSDLVSAFGLSQASVASDIDAAHERVNCLQALRARRPFPAVAGRRIFLVDEGLASDMIMLAAADALRALQAGRIIALVPTGHELAVEMTAAYVDAVVCANIRSGECFWVADAFERWAEVPDAEAGRILGWTETRRRAA